MAPAIVDTPTTAAPVTPPPAAAPPVAAPTPQVQAPAPQAQTPPARAAQDTPAPAAAAPAPPPAAAPAAPAAAAPAPQAPAAAPQVTREPVLVSSARPVYPEYARRTGTLGDVELDITIDESGRVTRAVPVSGPNVLRASAVAAVQQWRYEPAAINGAPVTSRRRVRVSFK